MAAKTSKTRALVLKKTRLKEKDLILSLLAEDGSLLSAVAKGARKPGGGHGAKVELFSLIDGLFAKGRTLDVLCESRLVKAFSSQTQSLETTATLSVLAELLALVAQPSLAQPRLFALTEASFNAVCNGKEDSIFALGAAAFWKIMTQAGFRPQLTSCLGCQESLTSASGPLSFSLLDGGYYCQNCSRVYDNQDLSDALTLDSSILAWAEYLLQSRYDTLLDADLSSVPAIALWNLGGQWAIIHLGRRIKSLDFLLSLAEG